MKRMISSISLTLLAISMTLPAFAAKEAPQAVGKSPLGTIAVIGLVIGLGIIYGYFTMKNKENQDK